MMNSLTGTPLFLLALTIAIYLLTQRLYKKLKSPLLNPLLLSIPLLIILLKFWNIPYEHYRKATEVIDWFLGMSVVALGYMLYEQLDHIKGNVTAIFTSILTGSIVGIISVIFIARWLGANEQIVASLEPKSVTTPIAVSVASHSGGVPALTSVAVIVVGIFGSMVGPFILQKMGVESRLAKGLALGAASHAVGTAKAIELGAVEGAIGGLAIGLMGMMTAILIPLVEKIL